MAQHEAVYEEGRSADRLAELGLKPEMLDHVLRGADAEARTYTELDPPNMQGMARYSRTVRLLREQLLPLGWSFDNPRNLARTVSPDRRVAIIATLGDAATGDPAQNPSTKYEKGVATAEAINRNFVQLMLPMDLGDEDPFDDADETAITTWVLLYHVTDTEIRAELSLPDSIVDGHPATWLERIVLAPVTFEPEAHTQQRKQDSDVTVTRRIA
ncbi:hypothetical protein WEI85_06130 [Actinomycetes bacterium KLBMP 9797]